MNASFESVNTRLTPNAAKSLFDLYVKDPAVRIHCRAAEQIMRGLARRFGQDEEQGGILGLLHVIDFEKTKDEPAQHCLVARTILIHAGMINEATEIICSHAWGTECGGGNVKDRNRTRNIEHAPVASETIRGLIYATALMNPEKKLANVKAKSVGKKYKSKAFARNCNREFIAEIENTGLTLDEFFDIAVTVMQGISGKVGL